MSERVERAEKGQKRTGRDVTLYAFFALVALSIGAMLICGFGAERVLPILCALLYVGIAAVFVLRYIKQAKTADIGKTPLNPFDRRAERRYEWKRIVIFILCVKLATYIIAYIVALISGVVGINIFSGFERLWCSSGIDAPSYLGIAENWYVTSGDSMYHIVFFPLYSILIRIFYYTCGSYFVSAIIVTTLASFGLGIAGYELARIDYDIKTSKRFVRYMFIIPAAFFYSAAMTEALFVFLSLMCLLYARKHNFLLSGIFGALAAFTRSPGILLAVPVGIEFINTIIYAHKNEGQKTLLTKKQLCQFMCVCGISLGLIAYLAINISIWNNPLQFSVFQREHWDQSMGFFPLTVKTITEQFNKTLSAINNGEPSLFNFKLLISLWGMELVSIFGALITVLIGGKRVNVAYIGYFLAYFAFTIGATWLLSAPRYLMAMISLPLILAVCTKRKKLDIAVTGILGGISLVYLIMYASNSPIY